MQNPNAVFRAYDLSLEEFFCIDLPVTHNFVNNADAYQCFPSGAGILLYFTDRAIAVFNNAENSS